MNFICDSFDNGYGIDVEMPYSFYTFNQLTCRKLKITSSEETFIYDWNGKLQVDELDCGTTGTLIHVNNFQSRFVSENVMKDCLKKITKVIYV